VALARRRLREITIRWAAQASGAHDDDGGLLQFELAWEG